MAETKYTHSTTGAGQFVGDAGLAVVAEVNIANRRSSDAAFIVWFTLRDGTGTLTAATYHDAYWIGLELATNGMAAGERVKLMIAGGAEAASTVRA
jgi:hypothetical protein